jgi:hypothetical protein
MSPEVYRSLLAKLTPGLTKRHTNCRAPISPETRLLVTLRYLALGDGFRSLSQIFRIGVSTARLIVKETCSTIISTLTEDYLKTPSTRQDWINVASDFTLRWNFPHVIGAVDGKHIRIVAPSKSGSLFYNYKEFFSVILLAVVDADYRFIYINVGAEGKASDGGVWSKSSLHNLLSDETNPLAIPDPEPIKGFAPDIPYFFVGDDAFRLGPNLLKPYRGTNLTKKERIFNYRLSRCRRIVENAFGILSCRFQLLRRAIGVNPDLVQSIVMACCILHNFLCVHGRNTYIPTGSVDQENDNGDVILAAWRENDILPPLQRDSQKKTSEYAKKLRNCISDYFVSKEGQVPWQYKQIRV